MGGRGAGGERELISEGAKNRFETSYSSAV